MTSRFYILAFILFVVVVAATALTHYGYPRAGMMFLGLYIGVLIYLAS